MATFAAAFFDAASGGIVRFSVSPTDALSTFDLPRPLALALSAFLLLEGVRVIVEIGNKIEDMSAIPSSGAVSGLAAAVAAAIGAAAQSSNFIFLLLTILALRSASTEGECRFLVVSGTRFLSARAAHL